MILLRTVCPPDRVPTRRSSGTAMRALEPPAGIALPRGQERHSWRLSRPPEIGRFAGKNGQGSTIPAFWGQPYARLPFPAGTSTATTGASPSPRIRRRLARVRQGDDGPFPRSLEHAVMQGKVRGVRDSRPLGAGIFPAGSGYVTTASGSPRSRISTRLTVILRPGTLGAVAEIFCQLFGACQHAQSAYGSQRGRRLRCVAPQPHRRLGRSPAPRPCRQVDDRCKKTPLQGFAGVAVGVLVARRLGI
jgi:hypothetical protein